MAAQFNDVSAAALDYVELIGFSATRALCEGWGGYEVYIPITIERDHPLPLRIGHRAAMTLSEQFGGTRIHIPNEARVFREFTIKMIHKDYDAGMLVQDLSRKYGFTARQIRYYIKRARSEDEYY